jgi:anti-sigma B factor antagonist
MFHMAAPKSRIVVKRDEDIVQIDFLDKNILEETNIQQIGDEIAAILEGGNAPKLLLCFQNVEHLSSAALGTLITVSNNVKKKGGQLRLSNIDPQIYEVFVITKLNKLFQIHEDVEKARKSFK